MMLRNAQNHGEISMSDSSFCVFKPARRWSDLLQCSGGSAHDAPRLPNRLSQRLHLRWSAREKAGQAHTLVTAPLIHARGEASDRLSSHAGGCLEGWAS